VQLTVNNFQQIGKAVAVDVGKRSQIRGVRKRYHSAFLI
jgi:hypothetical protein